MLTIRLIFLVRLIAGQNLYDLLNGFQFLNEGWVTSSDVYDYQYEGVLYTEAENVTQARHAWSEGPIHPYTYQFNPNKPSFCHPNARLNDTDLPGADLVSRIPSAADPNLCDDMCCSLTSCIVWTFARSAPVDFNDCRKGQPCCYLKASVPPSAHNPTLLSSTINRTSPYDHPPSGIRSSVPLGGVATGSIEIRADGTFHEWTIESQSPASGTKYGRVDDALLAFRIQNLRTNQSDARLIRTHSNPSHGLKGVASIKYHGAYPMSKFELIDDSLAAKIDLYAYSMLKVADLNRSMTPAMIFSLNVHNPTDDPLNLDFMFTAPLSAQIDQTRPSKAILEQIVSDDYRTCLTLCDQNSSCLAWNWQQVDGKPTCVLFSEIEFNEYLSGCVSGIRGQWKYDQSGGPLTLARLGKSSSSGQFAFWPFVLNDRTMTATVDSDLKHLLTAFASDGGWKNQTTIQQSAAHGAVSLSTVLQPGEKKTLSILFAWYFPHHFWLDLPLDNYYSLIFNNVTDVGKSIGVDRDDSQLQTILNDVSTLHNIYLNSSLPDHLVDSLINSFSHVRSAMYFSNGDWRQWEAYDCDDVDSVHNDHQRHLPYILYFPQTEKIKMYAWAKYQQADGMIQEYFTPGCAGDTAPYDRPGGRRMGDVTTIFILETLELYRWTNDTQFLRDMYPHVVAGITWQMSVSEQFGLPEHLECTYDIPDMSQYPTTTFNSFMHLAALRVCMELALVMSDTPMHDRCNNSFTLAAQQIDRLLWYNDSAETGYFLAYTGGKGEKAIFTDALYGQVLAFTYGLGPLFNVSLMKKHLESEVRLADTPYGLRMLTGREPLSNPQDNSIWMGSSQDWSALNLWLNTDVDEAMTQSVKGLNHVREVLNDQWNTHGLYAGDGYGLGGKPWTTSHYGFHMVLWHLPFAYSGQYVDLSRGILTFSPKLRPPYTLPVLIPNTFGSISATPAPLGQTSFTLTLTIGSLTLNTLAVNNISYPSPVHLSAGQSVNWIG